MTRGIAGRQRTAAARAARRAGKQARVEDVLWLREQSRLSAEQIAERMGLVTRTVRRYLLAEGIRP